MDKLIVTNKELTGLVGKICRDIAVSGWRPDYVVGITRGGAVPAVMISHYFNIPCEMLKVSLRDGGQCESNCWMAEDAFGYIPEGPFREGITKRSDPTFAKKILVVDDINDSGATINWIMQDWQGSCLPADPAWEHVWGNNVRFAVLYDNLASKSSIGASYVGEEIDKSDDDVWIDFPYESWWTNKN